MNFAKDNDRGLLKNSDRRLQVEKMLIIALEESIKDMEIYNYLGSTSNNREAKQIFDKMSLNKKRHIKVLENEYKKLSRKNPNIQGKYKMEDMPYKRYLKKCLFESIENNEFMRNIYTEYYNMNSRDNFLDIFEDDNNHSILLEYLYNQD